MSSNFRNRPKGDDVCAPVPRILRTTTPDNIGFVEQSVDVHEQLCPSRRKNDAF
jgi:hypothetical protein